MGTSRITFFLTTVWIYARYSRISMLYSNVKSIKTAENLAPSPILFDTPVRTLLFLCGCPWHRYTSMLGDNRTNSLTELVDSYESLDENKFSGTCWAFFAFSGQPWGRGVGVSRFCRQVSTFYIYQATRASFKGHKNKKIATRKEEVCHTRLQNFTVWTWPLKSQWRGGVDYLNINLTLQENKL